MYFNETKVGAFMFKLPLVDRPSVYSLNPAFIKQVRFSLLLTHLFSVINT